MTLEERYRRLLRMFPDHYADEMLGVLMAGAAPGRQRPTLRERADLTAAAIRIRLRQVPGSDWGAAARTFLLFGAVVLLAIATRRPALTLTYPEGGPWLEPLDLIRPALWLAVLGAALAGLHRLSALAAVAAAAAEIARVVDWYTHSPSLVMSMSFMVISAVTVAAVAGFSGTAHRHRPPGLALAGLAGFALFTASFAQPGYGPPRPEWSPSALIAVLLLVAAWWRQAPAVRLRMVVLAAPVAATVAGVGAGLGPGHWAILLGVPPVVFLVAVSALRRYERQASAVSRGGAVVK